MGRQREFVAIKLSLMVVAQLVIVIALAVAIEVAAAIAGWSDTDDTQFDLPLLNWKYPDTYSMMEPDFRT